MPTCKNDNARHHKGTEPSPKGLGLCAHAESVGATTKGRDGRSYEVRLDKNGVKAWKVASKESAARPKVPLKFATAWTIPKPPKGAAKAALKFDGQRFSDGTYLAWQVEGAPPRAVPSLAKKGDHEFDAPLTRSHWDAVFSTSDINLRLEVCMNAVKSDPVTLKGPVTAGAIITAIARWNATKLTANDYAAIESSGVMRANFQSDRAEFESERKTRGDCLGNHTFFEGLRGSWAPWSSDYVVEYGS